MKIVLCTPPLKKTDLRFHSPPIGLLYIASYLKSKSNHEIRMIDAFSCNMDEDQFLKQISKANPDVIGLSCTSFSFLKSMELLEKIKRMLTDVVVVLGGIHATFFAERIVKNYGFIDFVVKGEGEITFSELIENLNNREELKNIAGLTFIDNNEIVSNREELISDLDSLPFPNRRLIEGNEYAICWFGFRITLGKFTTILTSRSCPHKCTFCCCSALFKKKWRTRSVDNVLDELEEIYSQGYRSCIFIDDNFTLIPERVIKICRGIVERKIKMDLHCEGRVDRASPDILREMKKAGFSTIYFGIESGLQKVLDYYRKGITVEQIEDAVKNAKRAGLNVIGSLIIGSPVETRQDVLKTLEFVSDLRIILQINSLGIVPGTEIWLTLEKSNKIRGDDWKSVHSVSKYYDNFSEEELLNYLDHGYALLIRKLIRPKSCKDILALVSVYNMKIVFWNLSKNMVPFMKYLVQLRKSGSVIDRSG